MVPVDDTTLVDHRVFVLGGDQEVFDGPATFEVGLNAISATDLFHTFTKTMCVGYDNVTLTFNFIGGRLGNCGALVANPIIDLTGRPIESFLHLVQSPVTLLQGKVLCRQAGRQLGIQLGAGSQASQGSSAASQADSTSSWEGSPPLIPQ